MPEAVHGYLADHGHGAEWSSSWVPGPVKVAPTITRRASSMTSWLVPAMPSPWV